MLSLFFRLVLLALSLLSLQVFAATNRNTNCEMWAEMGECEKNPGYMLDTCAASCERVEQQKALDAKALAGISSFYDLDANDIKGNPVSFEKYRGKVTIITNVASYCGYTESHYRGLVELWSNVKDEDVEIMAFPCNQFGQQEPESSSEILKFAKAKGVDFTMMEKVNVNGPNASLVYKYLKQQTNHQSIGWNFATYFVVAPDGSITAHDGVEPMGLFEYSMNLLGSEEL